MSISHRARDRKTDGHFGWCHLKGREKDAADVLLIALGQDLRLVLACFRLQLRPILSVLLQRPNRAQIRFLTTNHLAFEFRDDCQNAPSWTATQVHQDARARLAPQISAITIARSDDSTRSRALLRSSSIC